MLRGLLHEIVRRRLWPIPVVALLVAAAAPLLFLKSSPGAATPTAQASQAAPAAVDVSAADELPVRARRLLDTSSEPKRKDKKRPKAADPFETPGSVSSATTSTTSTTDSPAAGAASTPGSSSAATTTQKPVPVVITDSNGKTKQSDNTSSPDTNSGADSSGDSSSSYTAVDVRFAATSGARVRRALPRLQPLAADGLLMASFVKYSAQRNTAVFAISPNTIVTGSVQCRRVEELCRYIDLRAGQAVRLTIVGPNGAALTRRLTVVRIRSASGTAAKTPLTGKCLLTKLSKSGPGDPAVPSGACD